MPEGMDTDDPHVAATNCNVLALQPDRSRRLVPRRHELDGRRPEWILEPFIVLYEARTGEDVQQSGLGEGQQLRADPRGADPQIVGKLLGVHDSC